MKFKVILNRSGEEIAIEADAVSVNNDLTFYNNIEEEYYNHVGTKLKRMARANLASFSHNTWRYFVEVK